MDNVKCYVLMDGGSWITYLDVFLNFCFGAFCVPCGLTLTPWKSHKTSSTQKQINENNKYHSQCNSSANLHEFRKLKSVTAHSRNCAQRTLRPLRTPIAAKNGHWRVHNNPSSRASTETEQMFAKSYPSSLSLTLRHR